MSSSIVLEFILSTSSSLALLCGGAGRGSGFQGGELKEKKDDGEINQLKSADIAATEAATDFFKSCFFFFYS